MSDEFHLDIDKALENAKETDLNGFTKDVKPDGLGSVKAAIENAEFLCGLDKNTMQALIKGEYTYLPNRGDILIPLSLYIHAYYWDLPNDLC